MGFSGLNLNCTFCRKVNGVVLCLIRVNQKNLPRKVREVRFVQKEKLGLNALLTRILALMRTWPLPNIVKTLIMPRKARGRSPNGKAERLGQPRLG